MNNRCNIPYKRQTGLATAFLLFTFGDRNYFPQWCVLVTYIICVAVPLFWSIYGLVHKDKKTAIQYLLLSVLLIIVFTLLYNARFVSESSWMKG